MSLTTFLIVFPLKRRTEYRYQTMRQNKLKLYLFLDRTLDLSGHISLDTEPRSKIYREKKFYCLNRPKRAASSSGSIATLINLPCFVLLFYKIVFR